MVTVNDPIVDCHKEGSATVVVGYQFSTSGAVDSVEVTANLNGADLPQPEIPSGLSPDGGWTGSGRNKTAEGEVQLELREGKYQFQVCGTQSGAEGRPSKSACSSHVPIAVACQAIDPCERAPVFGALGKNRDVCSGVPIEIHFGGSFDDPAQVLINHKELGDLVSLPAKRSEACTYDLVWRPSPVRGFFTFTIVSTGGSFSFGEELFCGSDILPEQPKP